MNIKRIIISIYILINLLVIILSRNVDYFCLSAGITTIIIGIIQKIAPQLFGLNVKSKYYLYPIIGGLLVLVFLF